MGQVLIGRGDAGAAGGRRRSGSGPRSKRVGVWVSEAEWTLIQQHAARERESPSGYVRRATLTVITRRATLAPESPARAEARRELFRIRAAVQEAVDGLRAGRDLDVRPVLTRLRAWFEARVQIGD